MSGGGVHPRNQPDGSDRKTEAPAFQQECRDGLDVLERRARGRVCEEGRVSVPVPVYGLVLFITFIR